MAKIAELDEQVWANWVATRPKVVQDLCKKFRPDTLYLLKTSNQRVTICAYSEDGTMSVDVSGDYNALVFDREVFGVKPEHLEECDLPSKSEVLGTLLTDPENVKDYVNSLR